MMNHAMAYFQTIDDLREACRFLPHGSDESGEEAATRQTTLTKPLGSLGRLEETSIWLARWQGCAMPARGVSAFPPGDNALMVQNFANGGAAVNQLAKQAGAELIVKALHLETPTADFTSAPAMSPAEFLEAANVATNSVPDDANLIYLGEMGIGNTTAAATLAEAGIVEG
jgi:nicotinate-nucleotide--dimethylbenzimidazole phosphoribosyltransferase